MESDIRPTRVEAPSAPVMPPKPGELVNVVVQVPVELAKLVQRLGAYLGSAMVNGTAPTAVIVAISAVPEDQGVTSRTTGVLKAVTRRESLPDTNQAAEDAIAFMQALAQLEVATEAETPELALSYAQELHQRTIQGPPGSGAGRVKGIADKLAARYDRDRNTLLDRLAAGHVQVESLPGEAMTVRRWSALLPPTVGDGLKL